MSLLFAGLSLALVGSPEPASGPATPAPGSVEARYGVGLPGPSAGSSAAPAEKAAAPAEKAAASTEPARPWQLNPPDRWYALRAGVEVGFVGVVFHRIQFGREATYFDLRNRGGQDVLFPFFRFQAEWEVKKRHTFSFLIQPIKLRTTETLQDVRKTAHRDRPDRSIVIA